MRNSQPGASLQDGLSQADCRGANAGHTSIPQSLDPLPHAQPPLGPSFLPLSMLPLSLPPPLLMLLLLPPPLLLLLAVLPLPLPLLLLAPPTLRHAALQQRALELGPVHPTIRAVQEPASTARHGAARCRARHVAGANWSQTCSHCWSSEQTLVCLTANALIRPSCLQAPLRKAQHSTARSRNSR